MMLSWHAVYTQPGKEVLAAQQLRNQGFDVYLPQYQKLRRHAGRTDIVATALFPRYLFVGVAMECQRWRSVNGARGVVGLVMFGEKPIPVPHPVIEEIRSREDETGYIRLNGPTFERGQALWEAKPQPRYYLWLPQGTNNDIITDDLAGTAVLEFLPTASEPLPVL